MNRHRQHHRLEARQAPHATGSQKLRELPADVMDSRDQADQDGRVRQLADEKRDDGDKGGEAECGTEESSVKDIDDGVEAHVGGWAAALRVRIGHGWRARQRGRRWPARGNYKSHGRSPRYR